MLSLVLPCTHINRMAEREIATDTIHEPGSDPPARVAERGVGTGDAECVVGEMGRERVASR